jgi:hypothetical protein
MFVHFRLFLPSLMIVAKAWNITLGGKLKCTLLREAQALFTNIGQGLKGLPRKKAISY